MKFPQRSEILRGLAYVIINFATPIAFFIAFRVKGAKVAIGFSLVVTFVQLLVHAFYRIRLSPFFVVASVFTAVFGGMDLLLQSPRFFRLEPFAQNFLIGSLFIISVFTKTPLITRFFHALPGKLRPNLASLENAGRLGENSGTRVFCASRYLRKLTLAWGIYLNLKAALFLYLAFHVDLGTLILLRSLIGGGSLVVMVLGEVILRRWLYRTNKVKC